MEDKKYSVELEVITPLSVGAGNDNDWMRGIDYVQKDGKVYVLDIKKAAEQGVDIDRLTTLFENSNEKGISQLIGSKLDKVSRYIFNSPVSTTNSIKTFLRTQLYGKPIVAGSSIKGSVRSALFHYLRETNETTNEEVFGNMKDGTDLMRFIRIADIEMPSTSLINTKIFNLRKEGSEWYGGWKHKGTDYEGNSHTDEHYSPSGFNTLFECAIPGEKGLGSITLAGNSFHLLEANTKPHVSHVVEKRKLLSGDISVLFHIINQVTKTYLLKEKAFFEKYSAERTDELEENILTLLDMIPDDDSYCLLKMSAGVGFHSITGDWQYDDYDQTDYWTDVRNAGKKKYKSRKTAEYKGQLQLMGFVKIRAINADEADQYFRTLTIERAGIIDKIVAPAKKREEERLKREEEERARQLAIEEEKRKEKACRELLEQARQFCINSQWNEAIAKAEEAIAICPNNHETLSLLESCKKSKQVEEYRKSEKEAETLKFQQPLVEVIKGKSSAGNLVGTTVKWLKSDGHTFGETEQKAFVSEALNLSSKELKKLKSKLSELAKITGKDATDKLCEELIIG